MSKKPNNAATLAEVAGTNRGLSKLTVAQVKALLKGETPAKVKAERPKSEFYQQVIVGKRDERQAHARANHAAAAWMREKGLVPSGQAWQAVKKGERSVKALRALNEADGLKPLTRKAGVTAEVQAEVKTATKTAKKGRKAQAEATDERVERLVASGFNVDEAREILGL